MNWKRADYLVHRWLSIAMGVVVLSWFVSGIVMIYYPWPGLTSSTRLSFDAPFDPPPTLIGVGRAVKAAQRVAQSDSLVSARLSTVGNRFVYALSHERGGTSEQVTLVDALTGAPLTPLDSANAVAIARTVVHEPARLQRVWLERHADHYLMSGEYRRDFPDWVVRFDDPLQTAVYVSINRGHITGVVTTRTRITTWLGTVPHWLYFQWLYDWRDAWLWVNLVLPGIACIAAMAGLLLGVAQLSPRFLIDRPTRTSPYRGVSRWHHLAGLVFGLLVLTWSLSGVLQVLGPESDPRPGQAERARGGTVQWSAFLVSEATALQSVRESIGAAVRPRAIEAVMSRGRAGYLFRLEDGRERWVDASTGDVRAELDTASVSAIARSLVPASSIVRMQRLTTYDAYYYARPGRELRLPVWRVDLADVDHSMVYLDAMSGEPTGFVDDQFRHWRWMRDGLHSLDFPGINNRRPLWDLVLLFFMLGGTLSAATGVWLAIRRVRRLSRSEQSTPSLPPRTIRATLSTEPATGSAP
ncbi:MAG TPA: hypothetical protein VGJ18_05895 [Gemmatimonadaceae bacterium]|jgi:hypothetical protein